MSTSVLESQICSKCGEENLTGAPICWACYWPANTPWTLELDKERVTTVVWEDELGDTHPLPPKTWRDRAPELLLPLSFVALFSSGWWRGKIRFGSLGLALAGFGFCRWLSRRKKRREAYLYADPIPRQTDMGRLTDSILRHSLSPDATQIRLIKQANEVLRVEFRTADEWRLRFEFPDRYWNGLQTEIFNRAHSDIIAITAYGVLFEIDAVGKVLSKRKAALSPEEKSARFAYRLAIEPPLGEIVLTRR